MTPRARSRLRQVELRPHGLGDEVDVLLEVIRDVGADERAHRDHLELVLARVIKDVAYERGTETLTFVGVVDLGVGESPTPGMVVVVREAGDLTVDRDLEPMLPGVLRNPRLHDDHHAVRTVTLPTPTTTSTSRWSWDATTPLVAGRVCSASTPLTLWPLMTTVPRPDWPWTTTGRPSGTTTVTSPRPSRTSVR